MKTLNELKKYAKNTMTPIIRPKSAKFLCNLCREMKPKFILEIGTAIGYSASLMLNACKISHIVTIEKDERMAEIAKTTFKERKQERRASLIVADAFDTIKQLVNQGKKFDLIFLDGPKGQYFKYLPFLKQLISSNGCLLADDVLFHGYVKKNGDPGHKHRTIVNSLRAFIDNLMQDERFTTQLIEIEDGLLLSRAKK